MCSFRRKAETEQSGLCDDARTDTGTVYKCALVNKGLTACPRIRQVLRPVPPPPGRWDRAIRNALTSTPGEVRGQREHALQNSPALNQAAGAGLAFLAPLLVLQKFSGGSQAAGSLSGLLRARPFSVSLGWCGLCAYRFLLWRLHPAAPDIIFLQLDVGVAYRDNGRRCGKALGPGNLLNCLPSQNRACRQLACRGVRVARASRSRSVIRARAASCSCSVSFSIRISSGKWPVPGNGVLCRGEASRE